MSAAKESNVYYIQSKDTGASNPDLSVDADGMSVPSPWPDSTSQGYIEGLYNKHWREICGKMRKVFGPGPPEPEDLAQEAFAKFISMDGHGHVQNPRAFIFKIALNLGHNSIKRISTAQKFIDETLREVGEVVLEEKSPEDVYLTEERVNKLEVASSTLSEKQRVILARSKIYGETYAQISADTGWSQADISRQLNAALAILQAKS